MEQLLASTVSSTACRVRGRRQLAPTWSMSQRCPTYFNMLLVNQLTCCRSGDSFLSPSRSLSKVQKKIRVGQSLLMMTSVVQLQAPNVSCDAGRSTFGPGAGYGLQRY